MMTAASVAPAPKLRAADVAYDTIESMIVTLRLTGVKR